MEDTIRESINNYTKATVKLILKLAEELETIRKMPFEQKRRYEKNIIEINDNLKETEKILHDNKELISRELFMDFGKAHGRIESLMILIGLNVK